MVVRFDRGVFENPTSPDEDDGVDSAIEVLVEAESGDALIGALTRAVDRWHGIDGGGRQHPDDDEAFWDTQSDRLQQGDLSAHTAKWFSAIEKTEGGARLSVDCQGLMPAPMRIAYRTALVDELTAAGVRNAKIRSQFAQGYVDLDEPVPNWVPFRTERVPGFPAALRLSDDSAHAEAAFQRHRHNRVFERPIHDAWEASTVFRLPGTPEDAFGVAVASVQAAGWTLGRSFEATFESDLPVRAAEFTADQGLCWVQCGADLSTAMRSPVGTAAVSITVIWPVPDVEKRQGTSR